jgi:transcriptional regulator with XRE-family HTH domain
MIRRQLGRHFLRQWREYRGLSLRKLAERMEREPGEPIMSHANLGRVETFMQPYTQELLEAAALALHCSVTDLLTVDPTKDGEVVDMVRLLRATDPATRDGVIAMLEKMRSGTQG